MFRGETASPSRRLIGIRYTVAVGVAVLALVLSATLRPLVEPNPYIFFFAAVAISAWYGGLRAGCLTAVVALLAADYFLIPPYGILSFHPEDLLRGAIFIFVAGLISSLSEARRRAEARAQAQAEYFEVTLKSIGDAVIATDVDGRVIFMNGIAEALTGWTLTQAAGKDIADIFRIVSAATRQPVESPISRVLREGAIVGLANHTLLIAQDGTERPIDDSGAPIRDSAGQLIGVILVFRDVTERARAAAALQSSRDQLAIILEGIADGVVAEAPGGRLVYANDAAARAIGYPSVQAMLGSSSGERLNRFVLMDEAGQPLPPSQLPGRMAFQGAESPARVVRYREVATGRELWALVQARPVRDAQGQVLMSIALMHDITAQKQAEEERARLYAAEQQARAEAEAAVRLRDQFLSVAAHELKTPLTSLQGNAQLFQRRAQRDRHLSERDFRTLQVINEQVLRLNKMVQALLDVTRLETGQLAIEPAPLDIGALVYRVVREITIPADEQRIQLVHPDTPILINGDALRLEQVLQNLIGNALKYSRPADPVTVTVTADNTQVGIMVQDRGIGIPQDALPNLFQRFYRAPNVEERHISGMGIGLYVVKEIVTLHGGTVTVESAEGAGTTFTVHLPLDNCVTAAL